MVRLLLYECNEQSSKGSVFQSHNGAIAAQLNSLSRLRSVVFQSHNGAIAAIVMPRVRDTASLGFNPTMVRLLPLTSDTTMIARFRFNPTMVRLLRPMSLPCVPSRLKFQSHNGAIAAKTCRAD